jgi:hypothetical protein
MKLPRNWIVVLAVLGIGLCHSAAWGKTLRITLTGTAGDNYAIDASTNLSTANWVPILTNQSPFTFKDTNTAPQLFYRARSVP